MVAAGKYQMAMTKTRGGGGVGGGPDVVCGDAGRDTGYVDRIEMQADQEGMMINGSDLPRNT